jgi:hypothetical protein
MVAGKMEVFAGCLKLLTIALNTHELIVQLSADLTKLLE